MPEPVSPNTLQPITIDIPRQLVSRVVILRARWVSIVPKDTAPLLDTLVEAGDVERGIHVAVVHLHAWVLSRVAGIHVVDLLGPLGGCLVQLAARALRVPTAYGARVEAACWLAAELGGCGEHVGVDGGHDLLLGELARDSRTKWKRLQGVRSDIFAHNKTDETGWRKT